jgi:hypothetical protein
VPRLLRRFLALSVLVSCAVLAGPMVGAQASDTTIRETIIAWNSRINRDEAAVLRGLATFETNHQNTGPVIKAMAHEENDLHKLTAKLDRESASTVRGRRGKADVTAGLRLIAKSYGDLVHIYQAMGSANPVLPAKILATMTLVKKGRAKFDAGIKLLS